MEGCGRPTGGWAMSLGRPVMDRSVRHGWRMRRQPEPRSFAKIQAEAAPGRFGQPEGILSPVTFARRSHSAFFTAQALDACGVILLH